MNNTCNLIILFKKNICITRYVTVFLFLFLSYVIIYEAYIYTHTKKFIFIYYIIKAETEKELKDWLNTFEIAKHEKLKNLSNNIEENTKPVDINEGLADDVVKIEEEDEDGEFLSRSFKGQVNSIHLTPNVIVYQNEQYENRNKEFHALFEEAKEEEYLIYSMYR